MRVLLRLAGSIAASATVVAVSISAVADPSVTGSGASWTPDPTLMSSLDQTVALGAIGTVQPPTGYTLVEKDSPDGAGRVYQWTGPAGIKGYSPTLDIIVTSPPPGLANDFTVDQIMAALIGTFHRGKSNWKISHVDVGKLSGQPTHRVNWSGLDPDRKLNIDGIVYGEKLANGTFVLVSAEDAEPDSTTVLPVLNASALTLDIK